MSLNVVIDIMADSSSQVDLILLAIVPIRLLRRFLAIVIQRMSRCIPGFVNSAEAVTQDILCIDNVYFIKILREMPFRRVVTKHVFDLDPDPRA
jgi:hypothetical protein